MKFNILHLDPIRRFSCFLIVFSSFALGYNFSNDILLHLAATFGFGLILYWLYSRISAKRKNMWDTVITTLIIFLLLHYGGNLLYPLLATFFAVTLKFFVEWRGSPIVNPAAAALLLTAGVLSLFPGMDLPFISWWGTSFWQLPFGPTLSLILMALWISGGFYVWKKFPIFFSFLIVFAILHYFRAGGEAAKFTFMDSSIYFLASIMLPEPKTSPFVRWKQVVYGASAAGIYLGCTTLSVPMPELFGLVGANLFNAGLKWKPSSRPAPTSSPNVT